MKDGKDSDRGGESPYVRLAKLSSIGLEMGVAVAVGWGIGYALDRYFGTKPWLMLVFLLFGVAAGFKGMIVTARSAMKQDQERGKPPEDKGPTET